MNNRFSKIIVILFIVVCSSLLANAQDIPISQYYSNVVYLNPGFTGIHSMHRLNTFYRHQWSSTGFGFQSFGAVYDTRVEKYNSGVGIMLTNEQSGELESPSLDLIYSYGVELFKKFYLNMGMQVGVVQNYRNTTAYDFEEPELVSFGLSKLYPDFALGAVFFYENLFGGIAIDHIARPAMDISKSLESRINRKLTFHAGYLWYLNTRLVKQQRIISPNLLIQWQGFQQNINWGASFQYDKLIGGVWLRHNMLGNFDAFIFSFGIKTKSYKVSYSYDMNVGKQTNIPLGAHEVSFSLLMDKKNKAKYEGIKTPTFLQ